MERQQKEYEAEQKRREKHHKERIAGLERIIEQAPAVLDAVQLRLILELLIHLSPYGLFEEAAEHFAGSDENHNKTDDEILGDAFAACADDKLMGLDPPSLTHGPHRCSAGNQPDVLAKAEAVFAPPKPKATKAKNKQKSASVASNRSEEEQRQEKGCINKKLPGRPSVAGRAFFRE